MMQQIFQLLENPIGFRIRYPTVLLYMGDAIFHRPVPQLARFGGEMLAVRCHFGSTMPSNASTRSA